MNKVDKVQETSQLFKILMVIMVLKEVTGELWQEIKKWNTSVKRVVREGL